MSVRSDRLGDAVSCADRTEAATLRPVERLALLCDPGSLQLIRADVRSRQLRDKAQAGDGIVGGGGQIAGRPVFCYAQDGAFAGGSVGEQHADTIVKLQQLAGRARAPVVGFVHSGGARIDEGVAALNGYGRIFAGNVALSGKVPQISVISGVAAGGGCYSPALTDFVIMTGAGRMFLTGPAVVRDVTGEQTDAQGLGGPHVHERNGVCHFRVGTDLDSIFLVRQLVGYLPQSASAAPAVGSAVEPVRADPGQSVPSDFRQPYDVREPARGIFDGGSLLEVAPKWAPNIVTALARLHGRPVGVVANQPRVLSGVLDVDASQKAARFVGTCNSFGLPLIVLVDTPGFLPGTGQEAMGVIRHGATVLNAFAECSVPRITLVLRKAFGGAYIAMNSKELGADLSLAWPGAQLGVMGAEQAIGILHRRELEAADDPEAVRRTLAEAYAARHLGALTAAAAGHIDDIVEPMATRARLAWAVESLADGR